MKVAIYCRLSEEDKNKLSKLDDSESIQNQKTMLIQHAVQEGWEIYDIYSDDDFKGSDRNRPAFNNLLKHAEQKKFDIVLCKSQSRFTRELEIVEKYIHYYFPIWGIRFIGLIDNADTSNKGNKKSRQINGLINEWYLEDLSENIRSVFYTKKLNGCHIGAFALYGYEKDPEQKGHLIIDEEAATIVKEVFQLFSQGYGKTSIAKILNAKGIPNPTEYKRRKGLRYKQANSINSTLWRYYTISDMLVNEMYIGNMVQNKYGPISYKVQKNVPKPKNEWIIVEGTHDPIIDIDLWERVQTLIKQRAKPFTTGQIGLFAKKAMCQNCGYTMRSAKNRGEHYLRCGTRITGGDCIGSFVSVKKLEQSVLNEIRNLNNSLLDYDRLEQETDLADRIDGLINELQNDISSAQKSIVECTATIKQLYLDKVKGIITDDEFIELSKEFHEQKDLVATQLDLKKRSLEEQEKRKQSTTDKKMIIQEYTNINRLDREHVEILIDYIEIGKKDPVTKELPVTIYWNF